MKQVRNAEFGLENPGSPRREVPDRLTQLSGTPAAVRLLTRQELADALKVSVRTVDRMLDDEEITPVILRGRIVRFYLPDVVRQLMARALVSKRGCARRLEVGQ